MNDCGKQKNSSTFDNRAMADLLRVLSDREYQSVLYQAAGVFCGRDDRRALLRFRESVWEMEEKYGICVLGSGASDGQVRACAVTLVFAAYTVEMRREYRRKESGVSS